MDSMHKDDPTPWCHPGKFQFLETQSNNYLTWWLIVLVKLESLSTTGWCWYFLWLKLFPQTFLLVKSTHPWSFNRNVSLSERIYGTSFPKAIQIRELHLFSFLAMYFFILGFKICKSLPLDCTQELYKGRDFICFCFYHSVINAKNSFDT